MFKDFRGFEINDKNAVAINVVDRIIFHHSPRKRLSLFIRPSQCILLECSHDFHYIFVLKRLI